MTIKKNEEDIWLIFKATTLLHIIATVDFWHLKCLIEILGIEKIESDYSWGDMVSQADGIMMEYELAKSRYVENTLTYEELRYKTCAYIAYNKICCGNFDLNLIRTAYEIIKNTLLEYVRTINFKRERINKKDTKGINNSGNYINEAQIIADIFYKNLQKNNLVTKDEFKNFLKY